MKNILVVCVANICRSPVGEAYLRSVLPSDFKVESAGIAALVGRGADAPMTELAQEAGLDLSNHKSRQYSAEIAQDFDLILAMEPGHKTRMAEIAPQFSGRIMLFDHWLGGTGILDPYRLEATVQRDVFNMITQAGDGWAQRLGPKG